MSMDQLPDEILLMIFRYVDDSREMIKLEHVCRLWRKLMRDHGWKYLREVKNCQRHRGLTPDKWVVPIGARCGDHLVECNFYDLNIDSNMMRLIAGNLPALRHLYFLDCRLEKLGVTTLNPFREFCARLRSLSFFIMDYQTHHNHSLLRHFPRLRHLSLWFPFQHTYSYNISNHFSGYLRSLYLNCHLNNSSLLEQMLAKLQTDSPGLVALMLDAYVSETMLLQISELKSLRFLQLALGYNSDLLSSCLANLPHLRALQLVLSELWLSDVFRSPSFRGLDHLSLSLFANPPTNFKSVGLLSTVAPQLRSLSLNILSDELLNQCNGFECEVLKIAHNGKLEHLNVPCAFFTVAELEQLVRLCPNLRHLHTRLSSPGIMSESVFVELRRVVKEQWRAGTRKHFPLRIWIHGVLHGHVSAAIWHDPFLTVHYGGRSFVPFNPVLDQLFREEVFNGNDDGGIPCYVKEYYGGQNGPRFPTNDLVLY